MVDGRRWRASDPSLPEDLREELVGELMAARRAVRAAGDDEDAERAARDRVQDAKVALGERGPRWWEELDRAAVEARRAATARALARRRGVASGAAGVARDVARATDHLVAR